MRPRERVVVLPSSSAVGYQSARQVQPHTRHHVTSAGAAADLGVHMQEVGKMGEEEVEVMLVHTS